MALSFASGLPLGLVLKAIPFWLQQQGLDIRTIGLITAAQAPYAFKFLWSPLMDHFAPSGARKRSWIAAGQFALLLTTALLCLMADRPSAYAVGVLTLFISLASATQDIAIDAYAVEALRPEEQGLAVGARIALYRAAMFVGGALVVSLGPVLGWRAVFGALAATYGLFLVVTAWAPEPPVP
ncbi:MAG TPA: MFS transporter, partial [Myxococcaceae bacterium]|nr:MFS transporter [Myxococcaceae bacterium]